MYEYINGIIRDIENNYIVLENNEIGYKIFVPNPYVYKIDNKYKIYIYTKIQEDDHLLYGFKDKDEKNMFLKLISVQGVGPKIALPMLATGSINGLNDAIENENILYLKKFPKIGDKVARQIILDLKGKLINSNENINISNELVDVLEGLGYKQTDIKKIITHVNYDNPIEVQVKEALKLLLK